MYEDDLGNMIGVIDQLMGMGPMPEEEEFPGTDQEQPDDPDDPGMMTEDELMSAVRDEMSKASDDFNYEDLEKSLDYYNAKLPLPKETETEEKFNGYVSPDVRNAVESTLAEIMPGFYGDSPVVFVPMGPGDEQRSQQETRIVHHVVMDVNSGFTVLARAFKDALISRNAIVKVSWDDTVKIYGRRLKGVDINTMTQIVGSVTAADQQPDGTYTADIIERCGSGRPLIEWIPREELLVNPDHSDVSLDNARFVCHRRQVSASDLVAAGVPMETVEDLRSGTLDSDDYSYGKDHTVESESAHDSTRLIVVAESYYLIDVDGDGIAERRRVITAGGPEGDQVLLSEEPWGEQPFAHGVAFFAARGWSGISMKDRLAGIQDTKSDLSRQILDTGWRNLQQRVMAVERMVNIDDLMSSKRGGVVRVKDINAVAALNEINLPQHSFMLLEGLDKTRRESGAGAIDSAPQAQEMGADSAHGIERIMSAVEESNALVAKTLAETLVASIYKKTHALLRQFWPGVIQAKVDGTWLSQTPRQWAERNSVSIVVGLSTGTRMRYAQSLANIIQQQGADMAAGLDSVLVTPANMYASRVDYCRLVGVRYPEQYFVDPSSQEGQQLAQKKQQAAQQAQEQATQQAAMLEMHKSETLKDIERIRAASSVEETKIKDALERYKADLEHLEKTIDQRLKLIEMNADYDKEPVPDSTAGKSVTGV